MSQIHLSVHVLTLPSSFLAFSSIVYTLTGNNDGAGGPRTKFPIHLTAQQKVNIPSPRNAAKIPGKDLIGPTSVTCPCQTNCCGQVMESPD